MQVDAGVPILAIGGDEKPVVAVTPGAEGKTLEWRDVAGTVRFAATAG